MLRPTREVALWGIVTVLAALPRLLDLHFPLADAEATLALHALDGVRGGLVGFPNPVYGVLQMATFAIFGASDAGARLFSALAGLLLCLAPVLVRGQLGRPRALILAALLALSPTLWFASRLADGAILAWTLAVGAFCAWTSGRRVSAAVLLGVLVACGRDAPPAVITTIVASIAATGIIVPSRRMGMAFGLSFLAAATALLLRPSGAGDAFNGFAQWAQGLRGPEVLSVSRLLLGLATSEVVVIIGALFGLGTLLAMRQPRGRGDTSQAGARSLSGLGDTGGIQGIEGAWLVWIGVGVVTLLADMGRTATGLVPLIFGCAGLASHAYTRLLAALTGSVHPEREGIVAGITFVLMVYAGLGLRQYAGQGQSSWLFPIVIATLLVLAIIAAGSFGLDYLTVLSGTAAGLVASMLLYSLGVGLQLNHARLNNPAEPYQASVALDGVSTLQETLRNISIRTTGEPRALTINVPDSTPPAVRWVLRDEKQVNTADVHSDAALTALQNKPASGDYIGLSFGVTASAPLSNLRCEPKAPGGLDCLSLARWLVFRTVDDIRTDRWVLWLRGDVAAKVGGKR